MTLSAAIYSMTGFGFAESETEIGRIGVEIRSVNNRFLDLSFRMPREFNLLEMHLRALVKEKISRGKVDLSIKWRINPDIAPRLEINEAALETYAKQIQSVQHRLNDNAPLPLAYLLDLPGVTGGALSPQVEEEVIWKCLRSVTSQALDRLAEERAKEGAVLAADVRGQLSFISEQMQIVQQAAPEVIVRHRERLMKKIEEWREQNNATIDEGRLEAEVLFFADRADVNEEIVRLGSHIGKFTSALDKPKASIGRDLDFLTQELLREINTIGSKARDTSMVNCVLAMKGSVEKIREQIQNIE